MMKSQQVATDVAALLRARNSFLWIVTREEARVERFIYEAAASAGYVARFHDIAQGITEISGAVYTGSFDEDEIKDPVTMLKYIADCANPRRQRGERGVWVMRDLPVWLDGLPGAQPSRHLRNLSRSLPQSPRECAQAVIIITPRGDIPPELDGHATLIEWPLPDRGEIESILDAAIAGLPEAMQKTALAAGTRDNAIDAAVGLTGEEAASCYAKSLVQKKVIDPEIVNGEKKRIVEKAGLLEWFDPLKGGLDSVGGLENAKEWLMLRETSYTKEARDYGLPAPKGMLAVGVPGCGKSLLAKALATAWGVPLIRVDLGGLKSKYVGESEANLRKALRTIDAINRCVVWIDEIDKALAGAIQGAADGGVSTDVLGTLLTYMQERTSESFVFATANNIESMAEKTSELLRRFDKTFFMDVPNYDERVSVLHAALRTHGRTASNVNAYTIADATEGFTGAEIAGLVPEAMFIAFNDSAREISTDDLLQVASTVVPLTKTAAERIDGLRKWASGRAANASKSVVAKADARVATRQLDMQ